MRFWSTISIHAPAKGATTYICSPANYAGYFNPRSREGSDAKSAFKTLPLSNISIHAPAKGATLQLLLEIPIKSISIHAPAKGATCSNVLISNVRHNFNPRSREGSDFSPNRQTHICQISIHAPAKGATFRPYC